MSVNLSNSIYIVNGCSNATVMYGSTCFQRAGLTKQYSVQLCCFSLSGTPSFHSSFNGCHGQLWLRLEVSCSYIEL